MEGRDDESSGSGLSIQLSHDLLIRVLELLRQDYDTLYHCSLVNWAFNQAASTMLYARVVISPPFRHVLDLKDTSGPIPTTSNFRSACLPKNALKVLTLEVSGHISPRLPPRNVLSSTLEQALQNFTNLRNIQFTPTTYHEDLFNASLALLCSPEYKTLRLNHQRWLTSLTINASCMDKARVPLLVQIDGLERLTLDSPGRTVLQVLPNWLRSLSKTLVELHLKNNCGSVTPGVLRSFLPHVKERLRGFTLGLSYSLTDEDVVTFIDELHNLERLCLRYYWQLKKPPHPPTLSNLRSFTVRHPFSLSSEEGPAQPPSKDEIDAFCVWIRRVISKSPLSDELILVGEDEGEGRRYPIDGNWTLIARSAVQITKDEDEETEQATEWRGIRAPRPSFDPLVEHLVAKHMNSLRVLDLGTVGFVTNKALVKLLNAGGNLLEVLRICAPPNVLEVLRRTLTAEAGSNLKYASFMLCDLPKRGFGHEEIEQKANGVFQSLLGSETCTSKLKRLGVNGRVWEAFWLVKMAGEDDEDDGHRLNVQRVWPLVAPWDRDG